MIAGAADQVVEARAFATQNQNAITCKVKLVVVGRAALVEADDP